MGSFCNSLSSHQCKLMVWGIISTLEVLISSFYSVLEFFGSFISFVLEDLFYFILFFGKKVTSFSEQCE